MATRLHRYGAIALARDNIDRTMWGQTPIFQSQATPGWTGPDLTRPGPSFNDSPRIFLAAIRTYGVRLLHAHHGMFALEFMALRAEVEVPLVVSFYGFDASGFVRSSTSNTERLRGLFGAASLVLAMSDDMRSDLLAWGCPSEKLVVHPPAVDTVRFPYSPASKRHGIEILCISDFSEKKGIRTLLQAFALAGRQSAKVQLRLVGSPITVARAEYGITRRLVRELGLEDRVSFDGWRDYASVAELYRKADIFVLASETAADGSKEGVPAVLLEAMACGRPVVSTYHAGIPEAVVDGETGLLAPERDASALAAALMRLITSADLRANMGHAGRCRVEKLFDFQARSARLSELYDYVLGCGRGTASTNGRIRI